jgi:hypothetical protein
MLHRYNTNFSFWVALSIPVALLLLPRLARGYQHAAFPLRRSGGVLQMTTSSSEKGKLLVLCGTGFLGQTICKRATLEGYSVTSLSRRGLPSPESSKSSVGNIEYRMGDACKIESISNVLSEGGYVGKSERLFRLLIYLIFIDYGIDRRSILN